MNNQNYFRSTINGNIMDKYLQVKTNTRSPTEAGPSQSFANNSSETVSESEHEQSIKSVVFRDYFSEKTKEQIVKCLLCHKSCRTSGNSSNMSFHLKRHHLDTYNKIIALRKLKVKNRNQTTCARSSNSMMKYVNVNVAATRKFNHPKQKEFAKKVGLMIASDLLPLSFVKNSGFRELIRFIQSNDGSSIPYKIPTRWQLRKSILPKLYNDGRNLIQKMMMNSEFVSATTDMWTSLNVDSYITVTAHFVFENQLCSAVLSTKAVEERHTATEICSNLEQIFNEWNIFVKVFYITTDNAANALAACTEGKFHNLPCYAHTINLVVSDAKKKVVSITNALVKVRGIVAFVHHSTTATTYMKKSQQRQNAKKVLKLIMDVITRWNSTYFMIDRFIELTDHIEYAFNRMDKVPTICSFDEITLLKEVRDLLEPFHKITTKISGKKYTTISLLIPLTTGLTLQLKAIQTFLTMEGARELAAALISSVQTRLHIYERRSCCAAVTILDPRFTKYGFMDQSQYEMGKNTIMQHLTQYYVEEMGNTTSTLEEESNEDSSSQSLLNFIHQRIRAKKETPTSKAVTILTNYITSDVISNPEDEFDIFKYWANYNDSNLRRIAFKFLSVPGSSVPLEQVFSSAGAIITKKRNQILPEFADELIFLQQNKTICGYKI